MEQVEDDTNDTQSGETGSEAHDQFFKPVGTPSPDQQIDERSSRYGNGEKKDDAEPVH